MHSAQDGPRVQHREFLFWFFFLFIPCNKYLCATFKVHQMPGNGPHIFPSAYVASQPYLLGDCGRGSAVPVLAQAGSCAHTLVPLQRPKRATAGSCSLAAYFISVSAVPGSVSFPTS
jgi:hypothetical protein